jgi:endonuclease/exonuclease/phosphatase family metal-dependent hydrolase
VTFRVATFNILHGARPGGAVDLDQLTRDCAALDADVLGLQEVDRHVWRSGLRDQGRTVARAMGVRHAFVAASRRHWFGGFGNSLLTRGTLFDVDRRPLPGKPGRESRAVLIGRVAVAGLEVAVGVTHLQARHQVGGSTGPALAQLAAAVDALNERPPPRVLLGDFNLQPDEAEPVVTARGFTVAPSGPTFPARVPRIRIDYVAVAGLAIEAVEVAEAVVSDHRPLVAELRSL